MFSFLLRPFFSKVLIGINLDAKVCSIKVIVMKNKTIKSTVTREFKIVDKELPMEAAKFIKNYKRKYPFTYLTAMSKTYNQGIAHCDKRSDLSKFGVDLRISRVVQMPNHWLFYIQQLAIDENRVKFIRALGLDYLFSPFVLIYENIKRTLSLRINLYVLQERGSITLMIADRNSVYFGGFFMVGGDIESSSEEDNAPLEVKNISEISDINSLIGSIDELSEIGELEDLDEALIRKEFAPKEVDMQKQQEVELSRIEGLRDLARASNAAEIIKNSINEYYSNPLYKANFLDRIVLLDSYGITDEAIDHIRNTLMLNIDVRSINIPDALIHLAQNEMRQR